MELSRIPMKELNFLVQWGDNRQKAWSGTNLSIFDALGRYYIMNDCPLIHKDPDSIFARIKHHFFGCQDFGLNEIRINHRFYRNIKGPVFQFAEILSTEPHRPTFIYQDLSVSCLYEMACCGDPSFTYSGFQSIPIKIIKKRLRQQDRYYRSATGIFTMGKWFTKFMKDHYPELRDRIHHVGGGINVDTDVIDNGIQRSGNKILFIGRDFKRKGGEDVLSAFQNLIKDNHELELHIAGPLVNPAPGQKNIFYYGDVGVDKIHHLMNLCDVFCMPSHFEAYGLVFIEALCLGLPCIGRDCFEMPYFIEPGMTGELIKTSDSLELEQKIMKILNDSRYRENVMERRQSYIKEYSWDAVAERIANVIG